jgi:MFS family permease
MYDRERKQKSRENLKTSVRNSIIAQATGAPLLQVLFEAGVLSLLILHLGQSDKQIGILFMAFHLCRMTQIFLIPFLEVRSRKRILFIWRFAAFISISLIFLILPIYRWAGQQAAFWFIIIVVIANRTTDFIAGSAWGPYLYDLLPGPILGRYYGRMRTTFFITSLIGIFVAGWILGEDPGFKQFYLVFLIFIGLSAVRIIYIKKLPNIPPPRQGKLDRIGPNLKQPLTDKQFLIFIIFIFLVFGINTATKPFFVPYLRVQQHFPGSFTVYSAAFIAVGSILSLFTWGKLTDTLGNRFVFFCSILFLAFSYITFALVPSYGTGAIRAFIVAILGFILQGIGFSGVGIAFTVRLMHSVKKAYSGTYMVFLNVAIGFSAAIGPFIAGSVLDSVPQTLFFTGTEIITKRIFFIIMTGCISFMLFFVPKLPRLKEPHTKEIMHYIYSSSLGRLMDQLGQLKNLLRGSDSEENDDDNSR